MEKKRKDELELQEAEEAAEVAETPEAEEADKLKKELEDLRDMFQQELDNAVNSEEVLIQELDEINENTDAEDSAEEENEVRLCECCGENPCTDEFGEDYPYCNECRELMKKYPMRWSGIVMTVVMIAVFVLTGFASSNYTDPFLKVADAALYYNSGKVMTGMTAYYSYISSASKNNISMKAVKDLIDGSNKSGNISNAVSIIKKFYSETELKMPWNKKYAKIVESSDVINKTFNKIAAIIEPVMSGEEYNFDEIISQLDALHGITPSAEEGIKAYHPLFIEYYKYIVMALHEEELDVQLAQLKKIDEINNFDMEWAYLANYCALAARAGDEALVNELFDRLIKINKEDANAYTAKASYYRWTETPDPDKILEICEEAKTNISKSDISYIPMMAIAYLLKGENSTALEIMDVYMSQNSYTVQTCNLYALCGLCNGKEEIYEDMKYLLENSGYEISPLVKKFKKGKITVSEVLADKGGSI